MRHSKANLIFRGVSTVGALSAILFTSTPSFAAGLEKSVGWSGRYAGIAGAAVSSVEGSESLFFNPANLSTTSTAEVSGNLSALFPQFSAPFASSTPVDSNRAFKPTYGVFASYKATDKLVVGIGSYVSGGGAAEYDNVDLTAVGLPSAFKPTIQANLALIEYSLGVGYEIIDGLRIGAAYRVLHASGTIGTFLGAGIFNGSGYTSSIAGVTYDNLSNTRWNGFRLGASYSPKGAHWGVGATFRNSVDATLKGTSSGTVALTNSQATLNGGDVTVANTLPYQITVGGHFEIMPNWMAFLQYDFTHYSVDQALHVTGSLTTPATLPGSFVQTQDINQNWSNLQVIRLGTQYVLSKDVTLRGGYIYTGQITPNSTPNPTFYAPGTGSTIVLGAGTQSIAKNLSLNLTAEYSFQKGDGPSVLSNQINGTYKENDYSFHLGATYSL